MSFAPIATACERTSGAAGGRNPWTKHTCLWGHFVPPRPLFTTPRAVAPTLGSRTHRMAGVRPGDSEAAAVRKRAARSATPPGFARAFFEANP